MSRITWCRGVMKGTRGDQDYSTWKKVVEGLERRTLLYKKLLYKAENVKCRKGKEFSMKVPLKERSERGERRGEDALSWGDVRAAEGGSHFNGILKYG